MVLGVAAPTDAGLLNPNDSFGYTFKIHKKSRIHLQNPHKILGFGPKTQQPNSFCSTQTKIWDRDRPL